MSSDSSYKDPLFDPHGAFNHFKLHPFVSGILDGGQMVRYGAKALPEGGWNTQPQLYFNGGLIVGDAANFVNSMRLKGIHLAMRSGMLAAETAFDAVRAGEASSARRLRTTSALVDESADQDGAVSRSERAPGVWRGHACRLACSRASRC